MANTNRDYNKRENYIHGNTVRKLQTAPQRMPKESERKKVSRGTRLNRERALEMDWKYVLFLAVVAVAAVLVCFRYLSIQAEITAMGKNITSLESELDKVKTENDTEYNSIVDSVDLDTVRETADELGMMPARDDQVINYKSKNDEYVKQYESVPKNGTVE